MGGGKFGTEVVHNRRVLGVINQNLGGAGVAGGGCRGGAQPHPCVANKRASSQYVYYILYLFIYLFIDSVRHSS